MIWIGRVDDRKSIGEDLRLPAFSQFPSSSCIFLGRTDAESEAPVLWLPDANSQLTGKDPDTGKD